jgi:hypothetical protein
MEVENWILPMAIKRIKIEYANPVIDAPPEISLSQVERLPSLHGEMPVDYLVTPSGSSE